MIHADLVDKRHHGQHHPGKQYARDQAKRQNDFLHENLSWVISENLRRNLRFEGSNCRHTLG
jgi:hypothetical protein